MMKIPPTLILMTLLGGQLFGATALVDFTGLNYNDTANVPGNLGRMSNGVTYDQGTGGESVVGVTIVLNSAIVSNPAGVAAIAGRDSSVLRFETTNSASGTPSSPVDPISATLNFTQSDTPVFVAGPALTGSQSNMSTLDRLTFSVSSSLGSSFRFTTLGGLDLTSANIGTEANVTYNPLIDPYTLVIDGSDVSTTEPFTTFEFTTNMGILSIDVVRKTIGSASNLNSTQFGVRTTVVTVVPEVSVSLFAVLGLGLLARRRR